MYDIKMAALELGVTVQTVYNHLKKSNKEIKPFIFKRQGTTYIEDEGLIILKKSMGLIKVPIAHQEDISLDAMIKDMSNQVSNNIKNELLKDFKTLILEHQNQLQEQYEEKLEKALERQREQIQAENQKLIQYIESKKEEKKSIWSKLLGKWDNTGVVVMQQDDLVRKEREEAVKFAFAINSES